MKNIFSLDQNKLTKHLVKAGIKRTSILSLLKPILIISGIITASVYGFLGFTYLFDLSIATILIYSIILLIILFAASLGLCVTTFYTYVDLKIYWRSKEMETMLPDFLLLTSSNMRAGMLIDQALLYAAKPKFKFLATEIQELMKEVMTGKELVDALKRFTETYDSLLLTRSFDILIEGINSGGKIASILNKIALNLSEMALQKKEMGASVMTYMIFISFASIGAAPVLMALSGRILEVMRGLLTTLSESANTGGSAMSFMSITPPALTAGDFMTFAIVMLGASSLFSAMIVSVIQKGNAKDGIKYIPIFMVVSILIYLAFNSLFTVLFGAMML